MKYFNLVLMFLLPVARSQLDVADPLAAFSISSSHTVNEQFGFVDIKRTFGTGTTSVRTELKDKDCGNTVAANIIEYFETGYANNEVTSTIEVFNVNEMELALGDNILFDLNGIAFARDADISKGLIKFCLQSTSIALWDSNDIDMKTFRGGYTILYTIVNDFVVMTSVTELDMDATDPLGFEIDLRITAFRCSKDSETFTGDENALLVEGDVYYLCLTVAGGSLRNVNLDASYAETNNIYYETISLVAEDAVTNAIIGFSDVGSSKQIAVPIIAAFLEGVQGESVNLKLSGNADVEFSGSSKQKLMETETYEVVVKLAKAAELGCFGSLFRIISNLFV